MSRGREFNAVVVDDESEKIVKLRQAIERVGGFVVAFAASAREVSELFTLGFVTPRTTDAIFIDGNLGFSNADGKEVVRYLAMAKAIRLPIGKNPPGTITVPDPHRIVSVGASSNPYSAIELGSYSDLLEMPLAVDWRQEPLDLGVIAEEVRRLKPDEL